MQIAQAVAMNLFESHKWFAVTVTAIEKDDTCARASKSVRDVPPDEFGSAQNEDVHYIIVVLPVPLVVYEPLTPRTVTANDGVYGTP